MTKIDYSIPIYDKLDNRSKFGNFIGGFYNYGGHSYEVAHKDLSSNPPSLQLIEKYKRQPWTKTVLKIALIFTVVLPLIAAVDKLIQVNKWSRYKDVQIYPDSSVPAKKIKQPKPKPINIDKELQEGKTTAADCIKKINQGEDICMLFRGANPSLLPAFLKKYGTQITTLCMTTSLDKSLKQESLVCHCPNIKALTINVFDDLGIQELCQSLSHSVTTIDITIEGNEVTTTGLKVLGAFLERCSGLTEFKLIGLRLDSEKIKALLNSSLKLEKLSFQQTPLVDNAAIESLYGVLPPSLKMLEVTNCGATWKKVDERRIQQACSVASVMVS